MTHTIYGPRGIKRTIWSVSGREQLEREAADLSRRAAQLDIDIRAFYRAQQDADDRVSYREQRDATERALYRG